MTMYAELPTLKDRTRKEKPQRVLLYCLGSLSSNLNLHPGADPKLVFHTYLGTEESRIDGFLCAHLLTASRPTATFGRDTEGGGLAPGVSVITGVGKRPQIHVKPHKEHEKERYPGDVAQVDREQKRTRVVSRMIWACWHSAGLCRVELHTLSLRAPRRSPLV